jgi:hypothetical protein
LKRFRILWGICCASVMAVVVLPGALPQASAAKTSSCPNAYFIGARGSGEAPDSELMLGKTLPSVYDTWIHELQKWDPNYQLKLYGVPYPAVSVDIAVWSANKEYDNSVARGVRLTTRYVTSEARRCPTASFTFAGYSQGADVVGQAARQLRASLGAQLGAVVLLGNPHFNPTWNHDYGTYDNQKQGILGAWSDSQYASARVIDYCRAGDPVCNYTATGAISCTDSNCVHMQYATSGETLAAGREAAILTLRLSMLFLTDGTAPKYPKTGDCSKRITWQKDNPQILGDNHELIVTIDSSNQYYTLYRVTPASGWKIAKGARYDELIDGTPDGIALLHPTDLRDGALPILVQTAGDGLTVRFDVCAIPA